MFMTEKEYAELVGNTKETDSKRVARNTLSNERGQAFEELIKLQCETYKKKGVAIIDKTPEPFCVIRKDRDGMFTGRFTAAKAQPDFQGTLVTGRSVLIEAKSTSKDRILQKAVTPTQSELLTAHEKMHAICMVVCEIEQRYFAVPWFIWSDMKNVFGHLYVTAKEIERYEVKPERGEIIPFLKWSLVM